MRHARWSLAAALALAVGGLAHGQGANIPQFQPAGFSSALTGIKPTDVQFRQVDTQALLRAPAPTMTNVSQNRFSFKNLFRNVFSFGGKTVHGVSPLPDPKTVPGWQFPSSPIRPVKPVIPNPIVQ